MRLCVVTGAAGGIGRATVLRLEELGWHVLAVDVDEANLGRLDTATSSRVQVLPCDVTSPDACAQLKERVHERSAELGVPGLAGLANVAGVMQHCPAAHVEEAQLRKALAVNCEAPVRLTRLFMPMLLSTERPTVVNVASITADIPLLWSGIYAATKGFLSNFSDSLRREAAANGLPLRVCCLKPGLIGTPLTDGLMKAQVQWCEQNTSSPFQPSMQSSSTRADYILTHKQLPGRLGKWLRFIGDPKAPLCNPPEDVAEDVARAMCLRYPSFFYYTATIPFKMLMYPTEFMPGSWQDFTLKWLC